MIRGFRIIRNRNIRIQRAEPLIPIQVQRICQKKTPQETADSSQPMHQRKYVTKANAAKLICEAKPAMVPAAQEVRKRELVRGARGDSHDKVPHLDQSNAGAPLTEPLTCRKTTPGAPRELRLGQIDRASHALSIYLGPSSGEAL